MIEISPYPPTFGETRELTTDESNSQNLKKWDELVWLLTREDTESTDKGAVDDE